MLPSKVVSEEVFVPFPVPREQIRRGTEFRSTWLTASLGVLRERGLFDRYLENLPAAYRDAVLQSVAGVWLPVDVCVAHYRAVDALALPALEQVAIGRAVMDRLKKTIFSIGFHAAREVGVTPWTLLRTLPTNWNREWKGGGVGIWKLGPKDARIEVVGFDGCAIPYCRNGLRGVVMGLCELVCTKAYCREIPALCTATTLGFRVSWV